MVHVDIKHSMLESNLEVFNNIQFITLFRYLDINWYDHRKQNYSQLRLPLSKKERKVGDYEKR